MGATCCFVCLLLPAAATSNNWVVSSRCWCCCCCCKNQITAVLLFFLLAFLCFVLSIVCRIPEDYVPCFNTHRLYRAATLTAVFNFTSSIIAVQAQYAYGIPGIFLLLTTEDFLVQALFLRHPIHLHPRPITVQPCSLIAGFGQLI